MRPVRLLLPLSLLIFASVAPSASASTTIGQLLPPYEAGSCGASVVQTAVETGTQSYAVPAGGGVITSWQTQTGANAGSMKLKIFRATGVAGHYLVVAEEGPHSIGANKSPTFPAQIPVREGDLLGFNGAGTNCTSYQPGKNGYHSSSFGLGVDPLVGTDALVEGGTTQMALEITAKVEPDADHDGYGDETQDQCPADASAHVAPCPVLVSTPGPTPTPKPAPDITPPQIKLSSKAVQAALKAKAVIGIATTDEAATLGANGSVAVTGGGAYSLVPTSAGAAANVSTTLTLGIPKAARKKIKAALKEGKTVRASIHVTAKDAAGNTSNATQSVKVVSSPVKHKS